VLVARGDRVQQGVALSLVAHAGLLVAVGLLISPTEVPPTPEQPSVALVFAPPAPSAEPTPEQQQPVPPQPEPVIDQAESVLHALPPPIVAQPAPPTPHAAKPRPARDVPAPQPAVQEAAAATRAPAVTDARPVAGMESDRPPVYPETARRRGQQGRVVVRVEVSAEGRPVSVSVAQGSGFASLDDAAVSAVQKWSFIPATRGGAPVPAVADVPVRFRLID